MKYLNFQDVCERTSLDDIRKIVFLFYNICYVFRGSLNFFLKCQKDYFVPDTWCPSHWLASLSAKTKQKYNYVKSMLNYYTGSSLIIVFFLNICDFSWTLPVLVQRWCSTCLYTHWHREKTERWMSPEYFKIFEKTKYLMNTL